MATTVEELEVRITGEMRGLKAAVDRAVRTTRSGGRNMEKSFAGVAAVVGKLQIAIAGLGLGALGVGVVKATAEMENLEIAMSSVFGGIENGKSAVAFIQDFATKTPFDIQTLSRAFIGLGGSGIRPTEKLLTTLGDAASVTVNEFQTFESLVRIITRGVQGGLGLEELEQLVTAGIPVYKILNEQLNITRNEVSDLGKTAEGANQIIDALLTGLDQNFGGAMERRSQALSVSLSNLGIAANNAMIEIGKGGLRDAVQDLSEGLSTALQGSTALMRGIGAGLGNALRFVGKAVAFVGENLKTLAGIMAVTAGVAAAAGLTKAILNLRSALLLLNAVVRRTPIMAFAIVLGVATSQIDSLKSAVDELGNAVLEQMGELFPAPSDKEIAKFQELELEMQKNLENMNSAAKAGGLFKDTISNLGSELDVVKAQLRGMNESLAQTLTDEGIDPTKCEQLQV